MAYSRPGSSSDAEGATGGDYQVFLSFRGPDTRKGFTDFLYYGLLDAGVGVFRDGEEIHAGEGFLGSHLLAIDNSLIYIPIFSRGYACSSWCLRELARIVDNVSNSLREKIIFPIFYDVEPQDVRLKTPVYSIALQELEMKFPDEVESWRRALKNVGTVAGWSCKSERSEATLVKSVVDAVLQKLETKQKKLPRHLVGLDERIEELMHLMECSRCDVQLIVIYGMGGIGKTTVAKLVFNRLSYDYGKYCSFLEDVRESSSTKEGIVQLQNKLLSDIVGSRFVGQVNDSEQGARRIGEALSNKKVLVALDDVAEKRHIEKLIGDCSLYPGSRIIITTRDKTILRYEGFNGEILGYEIPIMDDALALQLFCRHAFDRDFPPNDYKKFSSEIVSTTGQLPLAIEVTGSGLKGKDKACWEEKLVELRTVPEKEILEKLRISYDGLKENEKQIFLDIACFFFNEKRTDAIYMWDSCRLGPIIAIKVLTEKCLIKELDNGKFWMHNQLIALGRQIVLQESLGDLGKQSRLWIAEEALEIIRTKERNEKVQALEIDGTDDSIEITNEELEMLPYLRLLKLGNGTFAGNFGKYRSKLRWISWRSPHQDYRVDNLHLSRLVVFKLDKNGFTDDSKAWDLIKGAWNLKVLSLTECDGITMIPNFSKCLYLERLTLARCSKLKRIKRFIEDLPSLIELEIEGCMNLAYLPEEVGALVKLERFSLRGCHGLIKLPSSLEYLHSLIELDLSHTGIAELPNSIQGLVKLESLILEGTRIRELPNFIVKLKSLRVLRLSVSGCSSPEHVWHLPSGIGKLENLEELDLSGRAEMKGEIPVGIGELPSLKVLNLRECHGIQDLSELPTSLTSLLIQSNSLLSVPNLSNLTNLVELLLSDDSRNTGKSNLLSGCDLGGIGSLSGLKKLDLNMLNVPAPPELASLSHLEVLTLCHLDLEPLVQFSSYPWSLGNLLTLELYQCEVEDFPLDDLPRLEKLTVDGCKRLVRLSIPLELGKLRQAWVSHCQKLVEIKVVGHLKSLESLKVSGCKNLRRICGLSYLKNLDELVIQRCNVLTNVEGLYELESLKSLVVKECTSLRWLIDASSTNIPDDCVVEILGCGDFIKQGTASLKRYREEILLDASNKIMKKIKEEAREQAADIETSDKYYAIAAVQSVVGLDDWVKEITDLLEMEVNDEVRIIGIYGADGIGKTTLAKAVYNRISSCFDSHSFLAEVEETIQDHHGIHFLQTKLICDILKQDHEDSSFDERIEDFLDIFRERKVLLVVDDVEEKSHLCAIVGDQLHRFDPGSRIIVTSQNESILEGYEGEKVRMYRVGKLDDDQAFELFREHAYGMKTPMPLPVYDRLSNRIVNATEKLPLAIEVIGSFLRGKSIGEWEKMEVLIQESMRSSDKTTVCFAEILDYCFKALDQNQKNIFLDIACFISGVDARIASCMWPSSYRPSSGCILMPLAKIGVDNELQMHRLLRRLGKRILNQEESQDPRSRRFCTQDMVLKATNRETGTGNVEARDFQSMPNIRFLKLDNAKLSGDFEGAFRRLRGLRWQRCPPEYDAQNLVLEELADLNLSWSKITEDWGGWEKIKMKNLEVLNLTGCSDLLFTPDFSDYKDLKFLILEGCSRLVKLDPSIGHLRYLVSLNLRFCSRLNSLPVEMGSMTALKELFIDGTSIREIPISIGNLKKLEILSGFECFPLIHLPRSICYLTALSELSFDGAKVTKLPSSLGELLKLRRLSLRNCRYLEELPDSIGRMGSLEELDISRTRISELPRSIRNLESLRVLRMDYSFIRALPREIGNLTKLEELHASWCQSLKGAIPGDIGGLHHLGSLMMGHSRISRLPPEISTIPHLHTLELIQCNEIEKLPKLPPSLIHLRVSSTRMEVIPLLEDLEELEELCLSDGDPMENQPPSKQPMPESNVSDEQSFSISFPKLRKLELSLSQVIKLKFGPKDIPPLKRPKITHGGSSRKEVSELPKALSMLKLYDSSIEEIEGLEGLEALKRLDISNCRIRNLDGIGQLTSLRSLILSDCDCLSTLDVSKLKSLKVLEIRRCKMICQIEGLDKLTSLVKQNISECPALTHGMARSTVI